MTDFPSQLLAARMKKGLTQEAAANLMGMSRKTYLGYEKGHYKAKPYEMAGMLALMKQKAVKAKRTA